jgi:hypothetical protein
VRQARELVFIASPQFCATAKPPGSPPTHEIDLVGELAKQMAEQTSLRVVICTPAADWVRLSGPASTYHLIRDLVDQGGMGRLLPFWPGPEDDWPAVLTRPTTSRTQTAPRATTTGCTSSV